MARRFSLPEPLAESFSVELPTIGHHISLTHYAPDVLRYAEPVILCHGLGANRFNMDFLDDGQGEGRLSLSRSLAELGFDTWVLELRGRGRATVIAGADWSVDDQVSEDVPTAIETVLDLTGADGVFWVGHSKGALLQVLFQARAHALASRVRGLVAIAGPGLFRARWLRWLLASLTPFFRRRSVPVARLARLFLPVSGLVAAFGRWLYADLGNLEAQTLRRLLASLPANIAPGVLAQFDHWVRQGHLTVSRADTREVAYQEITLPTLFISGSRDLLAPPESVAHIAGEIASSDVTVRTIGRAFGHSSDYGHGDLVLGRDAPTEIFPEIHRWLVAHARPIASGSSPAPDPAPAPDSDPAPDSAPAPAPAPALDSDPAPRS
ncbi:MAG: alpha/beta fold hydrolase [Deltaproteobacteria bacterium]|nr:alpha/beta fold hydrolase [Deltaproteobacteria bacterium]